jgi:protein arginine kinase
VNFESLVTTSGEWLRGTGPDSDIVISSRIRLARNLGEFPFPPCADDDVRAAVEEVLRREIRSLSVGDNLLYINIDTLGPLDRQFLVERQLISREHAETHGTRGVGIGPRETLSLMINEEDHLRMQVLRSGFALHQCWEEMNALDDELESRVLFAFDDEFGYLTSCPTNVGTGMRASVMLHLPGLVLTKEIQKVFQAMQKMSLAVRGLYGEGSQAMGDFYQISNQVTLGKTEEQILQTINEVVPRIIDYERRVRSALIKENRAKLHDQVSRAFGILRSAHTITSEETMHLLSSVRMGINLGLVDGIEIPTVNELFIHTQPAHLQKIRHATLESAERNVARAAYLRERLAGGGPMKN